jgi:hypothetical protein
LHPTTVPYLRDKGSAHTSSVDPASYHSQSIRRSPDYHSISVYATIALWKQILRIANRPIPETASKPEFWLQQIGSIEIERLSVEEGEEKAFPSNRFSSSMRPSRFSGSGIARTHFCLLTKVHDATPVAASPAGPWPGSPARTGATKSRQSREDTVAQSFLARHEHTGNLGAGP